ncbi:MULTISPECIES: GH39 family glycosyl hydrolase [Caproicibacterium]|uniref:Xylan 1,4-beta-xylosidase n=1 Tax=Caproicibacterium argilliputei TaxID=3030016 RepID=A0AA97H0N4_9FIRM|nr:xylan 1,4-beta-xylosidase [Caproicibacterium argilliputei]WOC31618.1 xylan 1,4-beta-xylosidase [Caproicibacterium argilliputei]
MQESKSYRILPADTVPFHNGADECVGTGRMGLALQKEYQDQLALVQREIGFKHIRGHGLFCEDMAIYQEYKDENGNVVPEYNFTYLDMVMDSYRKVGLRPFLELGFMPKALASGEQTVFYWNGNVTPPKSYNAWCALVQATLRHLMERYGADEVVTWPVEVWNEPNLAGFWKDADQKEYFHLFERTFAAVKEVDARFQVGGPACCGGTDEIWIRAFLEFCSDKKIPVDFISRHHYTIDQPEFVGHCGYAKLNEPDAGLANLHTTREITDSFPQYRGLPIHVTEFNTSYNPRTPLHDTNQNAAYIAQQLSRLGDDNETYSYWTFGDIFEESGVPFTPFHGGFGLVANGCIPKPTFWTFRFYKDLQGTCVHRSDDAVIVKKADGRYCGVAWNLSLYRTGRALSLQFRLPADRAEEWCLLTKTVDETTCNPLKMWHDMGEPASPSEAQNTLLRQAAVPFLATEQKFAENAELFLQLSLQENAVVYFELTPVKRQNDRGFSYARTMRGEAPESAKQDVAGAKA